MSPPHPSPPRGALGRAPVLRTPLRGRGSKMPTYPDTLIKSILRSTKTIAMVGASGNEIRPSYFAMKYLLDKGFVVRPVNPGLAGKTILGQTVYAALHDVPAPIDMMDIFRSSDAALGIVKEALGVK